MKMVSLGLLAGLVFTHTAAFAASDSLKITPNLTGKAPIMASEQNSVANIMEGNVAAGGSFGAGYATYSGTQVYLAPNIEYFLADHFSFGGTVTANSSKDYNSMGIGPSATYYFWQKAQLAAFTGGGLVFQSTNNAGRSSSDFSATGKVGMNYFITPTVAFGPQFNLYYYFAQPSQNTGSDASAQLRFQLSVYL